MARAETIDLPVEELTSGERVPSGGRGGGRFVTWRAVVIGSLLTVFVAGLTPYNDYVVYNTLMTGGYFPPAVALSLFVMVLLVNAPLHAIKPRWAFSSGELAVILGMLMVGCAVPGQGMMRALLPSMVTPYHFQRGDAAFAEAWAKAQIPWWLFPVDPAEGRSSRVVTEFYGRTPAGALPPYSAWVVPLMVWGVLIAGVYTALLSMAVLLRQQWAHNERLTFPIAQMESALLQAPKQGKWLNELLSSKAFWMALVAVFVVHVINGLAVYYPRYVPQIPLTFRLNDVMGKEPWNTLHGSIKSATLYFTVVGIVYFIPGRIGFSLFAVWLTLQLIAWGMQTSFQVTVSGSAYNDQHLGAALAFLVGVTWIGRKHWAMVTRHVFFGKDANEEVSYRGPALMLLVGCGVIYGWMLVVGTSPGVAGLSLGLILLSHLVVARVVAETGLPIFRTTINPLMVTSNLPTTALTGRDVYFAGVFGVNGGAFNTRESALTTSLQAHRVADDFMPTAQDRRRLTGLMAWALMLAFVASAVSGLYCYYNYATPISSRVQKTVINDHMLLLLPKSETVDPMVQHAQGAFAGKAHDPLMHVGIGAAVMAGLQLGAWGSSAWPVAPIGYLVGTTWYPQMLWWSVLVGWVIKTLMVRFGGAPMYIAARPFFVGLVFGECLAATLWLIVSLVMAQLGLDYIEIRLLPT